MKLKEILKDIIFDALGAGVITTIGEKKLDEILEMRFPQNTSLPGPKIVIMQQGANEPINEFNERLQNFYDHVYMETRCWPKAQVDCSSDGRKHVLVTWQPIPEIKP